MEKWCGKVAVVTGASSGIGAATARALTSHGMTVLALARRQDRLQELAAELAKEGVPGKLYALKTDLRKEEDILAAFDWADKVLGGVDVLINNAGVLNTGYLTDAKLEDWREMLEVNVLAVSFCTQLFLKSMERRQNQSGHIIIINSVTGHLAEYSQAGMYCASKHAVKAVSMCLRRELAEKNSAIKVTSVSPGPVDTEIFLNTYAEDITKSSPVLTPQDVVMAIVDALSASPITEICEIILNPLKTKATPY